VEKEDPRRNQLIGSAEKRHLNVSSTAAAAAAAAVEVKSNHMRSHRLQFTIQICFAANYATVLVHKAHNVHA